MKSLSMNRPTNTPALLLILAIVFWITCKTIPSVDRNLPVNRSYSEMWQKVDSLEKSGLPKSALSLVREIKRSSERDGVGTELIKSIIYESKYILELGDLGLDTIIKRMEHEVRTLQSPAKEVLHSYLAELYVLYLQQNSHKLLDRQPQQVRPESIDLMSIQDLMALADSHYKSSISNLDLNNLMIDEIQTLLNPKDDDSSATSTVYELLILRGLDHFENTMRGMPVGQQIFSLDEEFFKPRAEFLQLELNKRDTADHRFQTLRIFQAALSILKNPITLDLRRLAYVFENSNIDDKEKLYKNAIIYLINNSLDADSKAKSSYHLASLYFQLDQLSKAHSTCEKAVRSFPETNGALKCQSLIQQIEMPSMQVQMEKVGIPGQHQLVHLAHKNIHHVYYRIIRLTEIEKDQFYELPYEAQLSFLLGRPAVEADGIDLRDSADFKMHSTEFMIRSLARGSYFLLVSSSERFDVKQDVIFVNTIHISNLAFSTSHFQGASEMVCFNRATGIPLAAVSVHWYQQSYDRQKGRQVKSKIDESISDESGGVRAPDAKGNFLPVLILKDDTLNLQDFYFNNYGSRYDPVASDEVSFFLDRSIYRPGQVVHFKGIVLKRNGNGEPSIKSNQKVKVHLYDANGQEVSNLMRISNPFGSFNGSFILPEGGLLGQMSIGTDISYQRHSFWVEAYKRPSFKIDFDTVAAAKLGDLLAFSGKVFSYAGAPLSHIPATYRVVRRARYPFYSMYSRFPHPPQSEREISSGVLRTESDGSFKFAFTALIDDQIISQSNPVYDFEISVTAVDVSGESQASQQVISLGTQPFGVQILSPGLLDLSVDHQLKFKAFNLDGHFLPVSGKLIFKEFQRTDTWHRDRYWEVPDLPVLEDTTYEESLIWYDSPSQIGKQVVTRVIAEAEGTMEGEHFVVDFQHLELPASRYQIELMIQDAAGHQIDSEFEIEMVDPDSAYVPTSKMLYVLSSRSTYEPGEQCVLKLASPFAGSLLWRVEKANEFGPGHWQALEGWEKILLSIEETDRGGFFIHFQLAFENRIFHETISLDVPWSDKELDIKVLTLRDVTKPGSLETLKFQITRPDKSPIKSEVLASMFDASLDALHPHDWTMDFYRKRYSQFNQYGAGFDIAHGNLYATGWHPRPIQIKPISVPTLNWFGFPFYRRLSRSMEAMQSRVLQSDAVAVPQAKEAEQRVEAGVQKTEPAVIVRENFNENLFFYPELVTDRDGNLAMEYQMNDALTTWRLMLMAHDQKLASGYQEFEIISRKELMITSNRPRFLRAGDELIFTSKIDNLTSDALLTKIRLDLSDALSGESINDMILSERAFDINIDANSSTAVKWKLSIPETFHFPIQYTVYADGLEHRDAERAVIPVLENRIFVTATRAFEVKGMSTKEIDLDDLINQGSKDAETDRLVLDFTSNPTWYAIKALPYLIDYPYECSEQIFNRFFANSLGIKLIKDNPSIERVFKQWKGSDIQSPLLNDQHLKSAVIEETPWLEQALSETDQMRRLALYFEANTLESEQRNTFEKLRTRQLPDGGFSWFPEGPSNWFMSLYIAEGLVQMSDWLSEPLKGQVNILINELLVYLDQAALRYYKELERQVEKGMTTWDDDHLSPSIVYHLYIRSLRRLDKSQESRVFDYFLNQAKSYWIEKSVYNQAQLCQVFALNNHLVEKRKIIASLRERMITNPNLGAYWKESRGYNWWQMPIAAQSKMIEVFSEEGDKDIVDELKRWLLNQKRTNHWSTTKATSEAVRSLTLGSTNWLKEAKPVEVLLNDGRRIEMLDHSEAGSFRQKVLFTPDKLEGLTSMVLNNPNEQPAWGAAYFQYFDNLDQVISDNKGPLKIGKQFFLQTMTEKGLELQSIDAQYLNPGDVLVVQLVIQSDREMEFIHIKDLRGAGVEPVSVLSRYDWRGGLGYYFSHTDLSTHFFIDYLPRGKFVLQYELRVSQKGDFSAGNCIIQSMYAPEFGGHSKGERILVKSTQ